MSKIKIYCDENVDVVVVHGLRLRGVDAQSTKDTGNLGFEDEEQLEYSTSNKAIIFTHDPHFLTLHEKWIKSGKKHYGIIYVNQTSLPV